MKFKDIHDGKLWVIQSKTGMKLAIPLDIRLEAIGLSLADIVSRCRETRVISQYLVHYTRSGARVKVGQKIQPEQITRHFNLARDKTTLKWDKNPPTFHELRSLSSRLYTEERGKDFSQALLGHKSEKTASLYRDVRGAEWIEIKTA